MKTFFTLALTLLAVGLISSCNNSTTPTTPTPAPDYFKGYDKLGNYWVYERHEIDTNGNVESGVAYTDSTWVAGLELMSGKTSSKMITMSTSSTGPSYDTNYIAREGGKVYVYFAIPTAPGSSAPPQSQWALIADTSATASWKAITEVASKDTVDFSGVKVVIDMKINVNGSKKADTSVTCANTKTYSTKYFTIQPAITGTLAAIGLPISQTITSTGNENKQYYAGNIGLVAERQEAGVISAGTLFSDKTGGYVKTLLRYKIQ